LRTEVERRRNADTPQKNYSDGTQETKKANPERRIQGRTEIKELQFITCDLLLKLIVSHHTDDLMTFFERSRRDLFYLRRFSRQEINTYIQRRLYKWMSNEYSDGNNQRWSHSWRVFTRCGIPLLELEINTKGVDWQIVASMEEDPLHTYDRLPYKLNFHGICKEHILDSFSEDNPLNTYFAVHLRVTTFHHFTGYCSEDDNYNEYPAYMFWTIVRCPKNDVKDAEFFDRSYKGCGGCFCCQSTWDVTCLEYIVIG